MRKRLLLLVLLLVLLFPTSAHAATWKRARLRSEVAQACRFYHLSKSETRYLKRAAVDIVFDGAHESGGSTGARNGSCVGLFQFNSGWHSTRAIKRRAKREHHHHGSGGWRSCGQCATWRFVKVYKDGGKSAIRRHWAATLGR